MVRRPVPAALLLALTAPASCSLFHPHPAAPVTASARGPVRVFTDSDQVSDVAANPSHVYVATYRGILKYPVAGGAPTRMTHTDGLPADEILAVAASDDDTVTWAATATGVSRSSAGGRWEPAGDPHAQPDVGRPTALLALANGGVLLGGTQGLARFDGARWFRLTDRYQVTSLALDGDRMLVATAQSGLLSITHDFTALDEHNINAGIPDALVRDVVPVGNNKLWVLTQGVSGSQLGYFDGTRWFSYTALGAHAEWLGIVPSGGGVALVTQGALYAIALDHGDELVPTNAAAAGGQRHVPLTPTAIEAPPPPEAPAAPPVVPHGHRHGAAPAAPAHPPAHPPAHTPGHPVASTVASAPAHPSASPEASPVASPVAVPTAAHAAGHPATGAHPHPHQGAGPAASAADATAVAAAPAAPAVDTEHPPTAPAAPVTPAAPEPTATEPAGDGGTAVASGDGGTAAGSPVTPAAPAVAAPLPPIHVRDVPAPGFPVDAPHGGPTIDAPTFGITRVVSAHVTDDVARVDVSNHGTYVSRMGLGVSLVATRDGETAVDYRVHDLAMQHRPLSLATDARSNVWLVSEDGGAVRYDGRTFSRVVLEDDPRVHPLMFWSRGRSGAAVARVGDTNVLRGYTLDGVNWRRVFEGPVETYGPGTVDAKFLAADPRGRMWVGLRVADAGHVRELGVAVLDPDSPLPVQHNESVPEGGGEHGARRVPNDLTAVEFDREGNTWFAGVDGATEMTSDGVHRFHEAQGLRGDLVSDLGRGPGDKVYVATPEGLGVWDGHAFQFPVEGSGAMPGAVALAVDTAGNLWGAGSRGVWHYDGSHFVRTGRAQGLPSEDFHDIAIDAQNRVWFINDDGLVLLDQALAASQAENPTP